MNYVQLNARILELQVISKFLDKHEVDKPYGPSRGLVAATVAIGGLVGGIALGILSLRSNEDPSASSSAVSPIPGSQPPNNDNQNINYTYQTFAWVCGFASVLAGAVSCSASSKKPIFYSAKKLNVLSPSDQEAILKIIEILKADIPGSKFFNNTDAENLPNQSMTVLIYHINDAIDQYNAALTAALRGTSEEFDRSTLNFEQFPSNSDPLPTLSGLIVDVDLEKNNKNGSDTPLTALLL